MQAGWRVGSLFGIPLFIDPSWILIFGLVAFSRGLFWNQAFPQWGTTTAFITGGLMALLLFVSVLLHELGHSLVALSQGIKVNSITLFFFGGIASIDEESRTPGKAFQVAIAGPAVSLGLFLALSGVALLLPGESTPATVLIMSLAYLNLVLALFNMLPGLPLDGGQVLKALVWKVTGDRFKGVRWAANSGRLLGWMAIVFGGLAFLQGGTGGLWIALLGWFGVQNANTYDRVTALQETLLELQAGDAMTREFRVVDAHLSLRQFADDYLLEVSRPPAFFAASEGRYRGLVAVDKLHQIERSQWERQTVYDITQPLTEIPSVEEATDLVDVIQLLEEKELLRITVLSPAGAVSGIVDRGDVVRAIAQKMNIPIADALIKQIKEEGKYPPGLQLAAIAKAAAEARS